MARQTPTPVPPPSTASASPVYFHRRIMRRLTPVFAGILVLTILLVYGLAQFYGRRELRQELTLAVNLVRDAVRDELLTAADEVLGVSVSTAVREFALAAGRPESTDSRTSDSLEVQRLNVGRAFSDILARHPGLYVQVRLLLPDGQVPVIARSQSGQVTFAEGNTFESAEVTALFDEMALLQTGTVYLGTLDSAGGDSADTLFISAAVNALNNPAQLVGILQLELSVSALQNAMETGVSDPIIGRAERRVLLLNAQNEILLQVGQASLDDADLQAVMDEETESYELAIARVAFSALVISTDSVTFPGVDTPWRVVLEDNFLATVAPLVQVTAAGSVLVLLVNIGVWFALDAVLRAYARPLTQAAQLARQVSGEQTSRQPAAHTSQAAHTDEIGTVVQSLGGLSDYIIHLNETLRTQSQRRERDLHLAVQLEQEISGLHDEAALLNRAITLLTDALGLYHVQVFLADPETGALMLAHSRGRLGKQMIAQSVRVPLGAPGLIGRAAQAAQPAIAEGLRESEVDIAHLMPETRARLVVPLLVAGHLLGMLDFQADQPAAFAADDLPSFGLLAQQIATALVEARERQALQARAASPTSTIVRSAGSGAVAFAAPLSGTFSTGGDGRENDPAIQLGALSSAISIRGEVIGELTAAPGEGQTFTEGDAVILGAVAERVALAIENARLFQETQESLQETSSLYQLSRSLNEAESLADILKAIINLLIADAAGGQVWVFDAYATIEQPTWAEVAIDYALAPRDIASRDITGVRLHLPDHPVLDNMLAHRILLVNDIDRDTRLDELIKYVFRRLNGQALVLIPLLVRTEWRGIISIEFPEAREFNETEGRIFTTLIDQAGIAIENRLLFEQTEDALTRNENLYAASRRINDAKSPEDLVRAVAAINEDVSLEFALSLLEGPLGETGWPTKARQVAHSVGMIVYPVDKVYDIHIPLNSPMRQREAETVLDMDVTKADVTAPVRWIRQQGYRFSATFPLYNATQPIALLQIASKEIKQFSAQDYEVYRALTGQMSNQLQIQQLLTSTEAALDETRRLYNATNAITRANDSLMVYQAVVENLSRPLLQDVARAQTLSISLHLAWPDATPYAPYLECVYYWTTDHDVNPMENIGRRVSMADYPFGRMTEEAEGAVYIQNVRHGVATLNLLDSEHALRQSLLEEGVASMVIAPIQSRMKWFGVILLKSNQVGAFNDQYRRFLQALTDQVSVSVENQRLYEDAQNEARRAQAEAQRAVALNEAAQLANRIGSDFRRSLGDVFERVAEEAGFDRWVLLLRSESGSSLERVTAVAPNYNPDEDFRVLDLRTDLPLVEAVRLNRPLMVNVLRHYPAFQNLDDEEMAQIEARYGKHVVIPVTSVADSTQVLGSLMLGRGMHSPDLDARDEQLASALATQVAVALENRRLFEQTQTEQQKLRAILTALPAGVLVLDAETLIPVTFNEQAERYLRRSIDVHRPFSIELYDIHRTGTDAIYPHDDLPIHVALRTGQEVSADDIAIIRPDMRVDLLMNAGPILDANGDITAIVAAFQDISGLRSLENTLQETLRETVAISETQRMLSEAGELDTVLEAVVLQAAGLGASEAYVMLLEEEGGQRWLRLGWALNSPLGGEDLPGLHELLDENGLVVVPDTQSAVLHDAPRELLNMLRMRTFISVPLRSRGGNRTIGWLAVLSAEANAFGAEPQRLLEQIGDIAATAIDNRQLIRGQASALREAGALYQVTKSISRVREMEQLGPALKEALEYFRPDYMMTYLLPTPDSVDLGGLMLFSQVPTTGDPAEHQAALIDLEAIMRAHHLPDEGVYINDLGSIAEPGPMEIDLLQNGRLQAMAAINLRVKDVPGGWIAMAYQSPRRFAQADVRYLNTLADSASVVLDNIALFDQIQGTLVETSVLYQASRALKDASTPQDIVDVIVTFLIQPHINQVFIALLSGRNWESASAVAEVAASWNSGDGINFQGLLMDEEQFPAWSVLSADEVRTISDIYDEATLDPQAQMGIQSMDARSLVIVPLRVPKRIIGVIWLSGREPYRYNERELRVFQAFAEQASLSLEAAFLLNQTQRRARQLETSAQVSQRTGAILDLQVLLPQLVNLILQAFNYDHVQIFLMDEEDDYAVLRASTGEAGDQLLAINHKLRKGSRSVIGQVTQHGVPQIASDISEEGVIHLPNPYLPLTRSEMAIPLIIKGQVEGVLDVQSNQPNAFGDEDLVVLTTLAAQISVALENVRLYESAQQQADRMSFLFEVTNTAASADSLEDALQQVAELVLDSQDAVSVTLYLTRLYADDFGNELRALYAVALAGSGQPLSEIEEIREDHPHHLLAHILRIPRVQTLPLVSDVPEYLPVVPQAQSAILIPLVSGAEVIGLMGLESDRADAFSRESEQLLFTMASTLSAIVQNTRLLQQLQSSYEQLQELDRLKSDFLANMSHELRTPLNSIIGFSRVMLKGIDGPLTEMQEQDLSTIYNSGQHLLMLINDVLDQAKIAAGKMDMKLAFFDVKPVIEGVKSIGVGLLKDKPITLAVEIANNMPPAYGDEFRIRQVLINLVSNAAKFTNEGAVTLRGYPVQHETTRKTMIRIDVVDTGIGIAASDLPLLFEAFRQVDSSLTRTVGGTGLGLPIAKSLVEMQGGELRVQSEVNVGSTFSVLLPTDIPTQEVEQVEPHHDATAEVLSMDDTHPTLEITKVDLPRVDSTPTTRPDGFPRVAPVNGPPMRVMQAKREVLLIEDNKDMVDQFRRALQREGFAVQTADHPAYAEAMVSNLRPTLLVMDVNFANGEGWNILTRLKDRDDTFDIPIIVVSLSDESERAYQAGAHTFISRPFLPDQLVRAVLEAEKESNTDRILIIDDQSEDVRLLTQLLNENGTYRVFSANSGTEGISLIARRRPNLVILDLRMPGMDGFAVLQELRSNPETAQIPVLVVTGDISLSSLEQEQLSNVLVLQKTDISQEDFEQFIRDVRRHLNGDSGSARP